MFGDRADAPAKAVVRDAGGFCDRQDQSLSAELDLDIEGREASPRVPDHWGEEHGEQGIQMMRLEGDEEGLCPRDAAFGFCRTSNCCTYQVRRPSLNTPRALMRRL